MYRKINVFLNGNYLFSTNKFKRCKDVINHIKAVKHICIASIPDKYITVYDYDKLVARFEK